MGRAAASFGEPPVLGQMCNPHSTGRKYNGTRRFRFDWGYGARSCPPGPSPHNRTTEQLLTTRLITAYSTRPRWGRRRAPRGGAVVLRDADRCRSGRELSHRSHESRPDTSRRAGVTGVTGGVLPGARPRSRIRTIRRMDGLADIRGEGVRAVRGQSDDSFVRILRIVRDPSWLHAAPAAGPGEDLYLAGRQRASGLTADQRHAEPPG
jgi:hypothetical protein